MEITSTCQGCWTSSVAQQKRILCQCRRQNFDPWVGKIAWRGKWQPTPAYLPGEFHRQRSPAGYSPWGRKIAGHNLETKEQLRVVTRAKWNDATLPLSTELCAHKVRLKCHCWCFSRLRSQCLTWKFPVVCSYDRHATQQVTNTVPPKTSHSTVTWPGALSVCRGMSEALRIHPVVLVSKPELLNLSTVGIWGPRNSSCGRLFCVL